MQLAGFLAWAVQFFISINDSILLVNPKPRFKLPCKYSPFEFTHGETEAFGHSCDPQGWL